MMTVAELKRILDQFPGQMRVVVETPAGFEDVSRSGKVAVKRDSDVFIKAEAGEVELEVLCLE